MDSFKRYLDLMEERPDLFRNTGEQGEIRIIHDPDRILAEQKRIQEELHANGKPEHYIDIGILSEDEWFWTVRDMVEFPNGHVWGYIRDINRKSSEQGGINSVIMCMVHGHVLLVRKFRHEERDWSWEFPRGFGEPNLTARENALKELKEEIGVEPSRLITLTNIVEEKGGTSVFLAKITSAQKKKIILDAGEGLASYRWVSLPKLDELLAEGKLSDRFSLWAYALAKMKKVI
jgi:ADP-ribose pyrophosphatase